MFQLTEIPVRVTYVAVGLGKCNGAKASVVAIEIEMVYINNYSK